MRIGIDFDNTLVEYDEAFHRAAVERGWVGPDTPAVKDAVRDALRRAGREDDWTLLQGRVYGPLMEQARAFPGAREFLAACFERGVSVRVISHRTRKPFLGPEHDLHRSARLWLEGSGFFDDGGGLRPEHVFFEETQQAKLARIAEQGCDWFIDDLPEFLSEPGFPPGVGRILFDPSQTHESPFASAGSWAEAQALTLGLSELLGLAGLGEARGLSPVRGAANNRLFLAEGRGFEAVLKAYFSHPGDGRDRAGAEAAFSRFAWDRGLRQLPRLLAFDPKRRLCLFERAPGRRVAPEEAGGLVAQALEFFRSLNRHRASPEASALPNASEACFSIDEHLALVGSRVEALLALPDGDSPEARAFARNALAPAWERVRRAARRAGRAADRALPAGERCLSPSDFGFHNALLSAEGRLSFLDFEYAGFDDPAKTICDFFEQPAVPVPEGARPDFISGVCSALGDPPGLRERAELLSPVYRVKWACILLNDFTPASGARRRFALGGPGLEERRRLQFAKAREKLSEVESGG